MFQPDRLGTVEREALLAARMQRARQAAGRIGQDRPVGTRLARGRQHRPHAADPALGVGDGAVLFTPGSGRQGHVGMAQGFGVREGLLDHHELGPLQGLAHLE